MRRGSGQDLVEVFDSLDEVRLAEDQVQVVRLVDQHGISSMAASIWVCPARAAAAATDSETESSASIARPRRRPSAVREVSSTAPSAQARSACPTLLVASPAAAPSPPSWRSEWDEDSDHEVDYDVERGRRYLESFQAVPTST
jgi:hypothetical protein